MSNALFLSLYYENKVKGSTDKIIKIPSRTYPSVPCEIIHAGLKVEFEPITGRTHQLRVHSAHHLGLNCPIKGDDLYGKKADRLYLHAHQITFKHPFTKELMTLTSPTPF